MLIRNQDLENFPVLSVQDSGQVATLREAVIDPDSLKILAYYVIPSSPEASLLDTQSIREYSRMGVIIDSAEEFIGPEDVVRIRDVIDISFRLVGLRVESRKHTYLGRVIGYTVDDKDFSIQQLIVKRPMIKSLMDPELVIPRKEVIEVTDTKIVVRDEEKTIRERAMKEDFVPNFVNPFRNHEPGFAPADTKNPDELDN
ncbi:hypothetical protein IKE72_02445 [Candidatus Saccharibacteria bacterium]|nr:hypothetical protein [Candidatus Saccharibacteria bacterium]